MLLAIALFGCAEPVPTPSDAVQTPVPTEPTPTGPPPTPTDPVSERPSLLPTCEATQTTPSGTLCVIRPSALDAETLDVFGPTGLDRTIGLGLHVVAIPNAPDPTKALWIHIGGSYGRPYDPEDGSIAADLWLEELLAEGYTVVHPAYINRRAVNDDCGPNGAGRTRDDCAGQVREEVLTGIDLSPFRDVAPADSLEHRLDRLLTHLQGFGDVVLPAELTPSDLDWSAIRVSGHSQGGNQAYYLARTRGVDFACMLASPYDAGDTVDPVNPPIADWFRAGTSLTPVDDLGQVLTSEDDNAVSFRGGGQLIGLTAGVQSFEVSMPPYANTAGEVVNGHAAALVDPRLQDARASACLR